jgi:hypothetical protein
MDLGEPWNETTARIMGHCCHDGSHGCPDVQVRRNSLEFSIKGTHGRQQVGHTRGKTKRPRTLLMSAAPNCHVIVGFIDVKSARTSRASSSPTHLRVSSKIPVEADIVNSSSALMTCRSNAARVGVLRVANIRRLGGRYSPVIPAGTKTSSIASSSTRPFTPCSRCALNRS